MVPRVQVVAGAQAVAGVKMDFLVDAGMAQKVEQDLFGHAHGAEVLHLYQRKVKGQGQRGWGLEKVRTAASTTGQTTV